LRFEVEKGYVVPSDFDISAQNNAQNASPFLKISFSSSILALVLCLVLGGLSSSGVPSMIATHILFAVATVSAVVGVVTSEEILKKSRTIVVVSGVVTFIAVGGSLYPLDRYLQRQRSYLDALLTPPRIQPPSAPAVTYTESKKRTPRIFVTGNNNSVISQSPVHQQSTGPNSPNIVGTGNQVTINPVQPPRRIPSESRAGLVRFFSERPAKVSISVIVNDPEAYRFAQDWYEVLKAAGWNFKEDRIIPFIAGGQPQFGVVVKLHGEPVPPNQQFAVPNTEASGYIARAMSTMKISFSGQKYPDIEEGLISLDFYARPPTDLEH
jgi:small basic protein